MFSHAFVGESSWNGYENNCLFANTGDGHFLDIARPLGSDSIGDSRGVAVADFDGDGRLDLAVNNNNAPPALYLNRMAATGNWIGLELVGSARGGSGGTLLATSTYDSLDLSPGSNRDAVGARVRLRLPPQGEEPGKTLTRWVEAGSGFASQSPFPVHFGLAARTRVEAVEITWPSGRVDRWDGSRFPVNQVIRVQEGVGLSLTPTAPAPNSETGGR